MIKKMMVASSGLYFILLTTFLYIILWFLLYDFYSIFTHYNIPLFTLCRVPDKIFFTILIFISLSLIYILNYFLISKIGKISLMIKITVIISLIVSSILNILIYPVGAPDIFNYIANCKLAYFHHLNPYLHTFGAFKNDPLVNYSVHINMPLAYGPLWLILSYIPFIFSGFRSLLSMFISYRIFTLFFLLVTGIIIYINEEKDKRWNSLYLFMLNPLVLFEGVGNGHNDMITTFFLIYSVFKLRKDSVLALPFLTMSVLIKFFTLPLLPLYIMEMIRRKWKFKKIILSCILSGFVIIILFAPFWSGGHMFKGLINGMASYYTIKGISVFAILREYMSVNKMPGVSYIKIIFTVIFIIFLIIEISFIKGRFEDKIADITLFFIVTISLYYPWYFIPVFAVLSISEDKVNRFYILIFTFFGMSFYPLTVWFWSYTKLSDDLIYSCLSVIMILPVIIFFIFRILRISNKAVTT
ncbi:MAG: hypothetical protein ABRQ37_16070 [Candidatus Eremiobacterota bacterium]